ncbi:calcium-binding protein, partial [Cyanobium sp. To12R1]|uniref:beta strand repeat-containing protein n=1 Tax=Cyanobium sp. To12R1 TaxID=2823723 RepID=UPI0020CF37B6
SGLGNEVVIIIGNDAAAADLQNIDAATTGTIDATAINTITGTATDVAAVYAAKVVSGNGISGLGDEAVILNNAHSLSQLKAINDATTGAITLDNYSVSLNGSAVDIAGALTGITGYSGALTLTDTGSIAADDLTALDGLTTGEVDAKSIKTITGSATDVAAVYAAKVVSGNGILGLGNEVVAVIGMNAAAADLKNINAATTGTIEARSITTITGTATDVAAVYAAKVLSGNGILGLGNEVVVIIGMNADAADLKNINAATSGTVDAKSITTITGTATDVAAVYAAKVVAGNGISGLGNEAVILNTAHSLSQLKAINDATTGAITLNNYSVSLKGSAVDITRALTGITGYSGTLTLTDTGSIAADDLTALDALTTGNVDASSVTTVTGKLLAVSTAYRSNGIVGLGKNAVSLTDSTQTRLGVTASNQDIFYLASNKQKFAISYNGDDNDNRFTGLAGNDIITGKGGSDTLSGGLGIDVLTGDLGADTFRFDTALGSTNVDSITDFNIAEGDIFQLENTGSGLFTAIRETGELASNAFVLGAVFTSIDQRIRYESTKGNLFYDPDGIGSAKSVLFANVSQGLAMSSSQFQIT